VCAPRRVVTACCYETRKEERRTDKENVKD